MDAKTDPKIDWLGHDSFRLTGEKIVYIDPWKIENERHDADIVLYTHDHFDHFVPEDLEKVRGSQTLVVGPEMLRDKVEGLLVIKAGDALNVHGVPLEVTPAYNLHPDRQNFHPLEYGGVGYIVTLNGKRIYHTGDTDPIPEMKNIKTDIMLVPISGKFVCTPDEAVEAVGMVNPKLAIPMHWNTIAGTWEDANAFKERVQVPVEILGKTN
jgi:L-ascorbate metabolism protein UlaG (beta-lactamase superfamily)